ncbi:hypothetical protein Egran_01602 [Elaphomyces granulatus]|uniref:Peroxin 20 n=1 Tax=Elaphomyces granulatus TaxID=519963 RepID=A0A232M2L1_9EURO|nr:hypothetical protein Egran_01602 [Elaphomyces granulatus]
MADALCGPSNALQDFQKHASVDRTLQQDRLINRQSPSLGFRSQHPNVGILDVEFEAFEANLVGSPVSDLEYGSSHSVQGLHHPALPPAKGTDWATDFQRLRLSGSFPSVPQAQFPAEPPLSRGLSSLSRPDWSSEFSRQQPQSSPGVPTFQAMLAANHTTGGGVVSPPSVHQNVTQAYQQFQTDIFDESAFEAAFALARAQVELQESAATEDAETLNESLQTDTHRSVEGAEQIKIGSDTIPESLTHVNDADELAKTAEQLLDSLCHEQSQKFKQSNFLALMRRIRDREVHIEGDEFRETMQSLHPGGQYYPEGQSKTAIGLTAADLNKFDDVEVSGTLHSKFSTFSSPRLTEA